MAVQLFLVAIFAILSALHIFWAFGGKLGHGVAVPSIDDKPLFKPSRLGTLGVAAVLAGFAVLVYLEIIWAIYAIGALFFLRAIGEFRYVGFFKRHRGTPFAYWDDRLFTPLCLVIAFACLLLVKR